MLLLLINKYGMLAWIMVRNVQDCVVCSVQLANGSWGGMIIVWVFVHELEHVWIQCCVRMVILMDYESEFSVCSIGMVFIVICFIRHGISWVCSGFLFMQCWCDFECWNF